MIISIDFDGTIVKDDYPRIGSLVADAAETIAKFKRDGHEIVINTCRAGDLALDAINFLLAHNVPFDRVNENNPHNVKKYGSNTRKIFADVYIDDRNVCGMPDWATIYQWVTSKALADKENLKTD